MKLRKLAALSAALGLLAGCATPLSKQVRKEAVPPDKLDFGQVRGAPEAFEGRTVILGGQILEIRNRSDGTVLVVLEKPLDSSLRPRPLEMGGGRFLARFAEYLDPAVFCAGRTVTVAGSVAGTAPEKVGDFNYPYVVLEGREVYLWKDNFEASPPWYDRDARYPFPGWYDPSRGTRPWP